MNFGEPRKFDFARQVAAATGYVALCGFDRVTIVPFPNEGENITTSGALRAVRGRKTSLQFFQNITSLKCGGGANFNEALRRGALEARQAGVAIVLTDFLDPAGYDRGLNALVGRGFQVNAVQILSPDELAPPTYGDLKLVDAESGHIQEVTFGKYRLNAYQQTVQ